MVLASKQRTAGTQMWIDKLRPQTSPVPTQDPTQTTQPPEFIGQPKKAVATTINPVVTRSAPAPVSTTPPATDINTWDDNKIKDYVTWAELNPGNLSQEDMFKLRRGQQMLQERAYQQMNQKPLQDQITIKTQELAKREQDLAERDAKLKEAKMKELEMLYGVRSTREKEASKERSTIMQNTLSFSGFGRSTYAAEKQDQIQKDTNYNLDLIDQQKQLAMQEREATQQGATQEELNAYREAINNLEIKSAEISGNIMQEMNKYNMENAKDVQEKIDNIINLSQAYSLVPLSPEMDAYVSQIAGGVIDDEGNINDKLLEGMDTKTKRAVIRKAAEIKKSMPKKIEAPKTASDGVGNLYSFNEETGEREVIGQGRSQVQLEEITLPDGTKQTVQFDPTTGMTTPVMGGATGDLRGLASQFPGQAWAKNNNPAGITWNSNFDKGLGTAALLQQAGIRYEKGTARPANEGGNYVTFPTIEEGLAAQRIMMTQTYGNSTVQQMLGKWVGTGEALNYAKQVAGNAGVPLDVKVNQLSEDQLSALQMAKIQKESPGLAKILNQGSIKEQQKDINNVILPEKAPENVRKSYSFAQKMQDANKKLIDLGLEEDFANRTLLGQRYQENVPDALKSTKQKDLDLLKQAFITGVLRQESGAAITDTEFDRYDTQFFPKQGDSMATIQKKQSLRDQAIRNMYQMAGTDKDGTPLVQIYENTGQQQTTTPTKVSPTAQSILDKYAK